MATPVPKNHLQAMDKQQRQSIAAEIDQISKHLIQAAEPNIPTMSERVFVYIWLPFFAGDDKPQYPVDFQHWFNFTGNPYQPVNVVDEKGDVLFQVPPVFDRSVVNPLSQKRTSLAHVVQSYQQLRNIHPNQGNVFLDAELTKRALLMKVPHNVLANLETWNSIFQRYGRKPLVEVDSQATTSPGSAAAAGQPDISYDDFEPL